VSLVVFKSACRAAPPWQGSNMRTWFHKLPPRAHPETTSLAGSLGDSLMTKSAFRCRPFPVHRTRSPV